MKEHGMIFSAPMVRAILERRKTQTRRIIKPQPHLSLSGRWCWNLPRRARHKVVGGQVCDASRQWWEYLPPDAYPAQPGDTIWVREATRTGEKLDSSSYKEIERRCVEAGFGGDGRHCPLKYEADDAVLVWGDNDNEDFGDWGRYRHARFMPRWASRIAMPVKSVRVALVQDISEADAMAEGVDGGCLECGVPYGKCVCIDGPKPIYVDGFSFLWQEIHGPGAWIRNDWVWVYEWEPLP